MPIDPIERRMTAGETSNPRNPRDAGPAGSGRAASGDGVDISPAARDQLQIHETVLAVHQAAGELPDVRPERVDEVRHRIQQGYYERADVRGSVIDALLRSFHQD